MSLSVPNVMETSVAAATARVLIVDDEPLARDCMRLALRGARNVELVAECCDGASAVDAIRHHSPDIVFLDVQMPGLDGFAVLDQIEPAMMPVVVFVTAFDSHAIRAFEVNALDYVLKPNPHERKHPALDRARTAIQERRNAELGRRLAAILQDRQAGTLHRGRSIPRPTTAPTPPVLVVTLHVAPSHDSKTTTKRPSGSRATSGLMSGMARSAIKVSVPESRTPPRSSIVV